MYFIKYNMSANSSYVDQFKKNDDVFRNTMEYIFQKYSRIHDPGIDVCLKTMTCRTGRGPVPIDSVEGERELETLKTRVKANHSIRELEDQENDQPMDLSGITEDDLTYSDQNENNENLWHDGDSPQPSVNGINSSNSCLWGVTSQPKEENEELEKTLSSHGSTLLDVYPSMLTQIGEAYRRQHVTDTARAVLQKYRRKQRPIGQSNPRCTSLKNSALNKTTEISFSKQSPVRINLSNCIDDSSKFQNLFKTNLKCSPCKSPSYEASACFYSPRRDNADVSGISNKSPWTEVHLDRKPKPKPARVIDFSTPPCSFSPSLSYKSPDLNQIYDIGPILSTSNAVQASLISTCPQPAWHSPGRAAKGQSLIEQRGLSITPRLCDQQSSHSSLDKDCFKDRLHSAAWSPQRGFSCLSPRKSTFRPTSMLKMEIQQLKPMSIHSPEKRSPLHLQAHSERSPYGGKKVVMSSPRHSVYHHLEHQPSFSMAEKQSQVSPRLSKHQGFLMSPKSTNLVKHDLSSRSQIDAEFRKLYHHFICHGISSPCPSSHCHLCKRQLKEMPQSPGFSSSSMSALALTPLRATLKKRRRFPEVEESLRFKRFRESCSPIKHLQLQPHQLKDRFMNSSMAKPIEDKHTWERAILLQCPSPQFLRGTGNLRRIRESKLGLQVYPSASSLKDVPSGVHAVKAESPQRLFNQGMTPFSPSLSRRRLQYSLLQ